MTWKLPMNSVRIFLFALILILFTPLSGCVIGSTPPSQFYLLEPIAELNEPASTSAPLTSVALAPVRIPRYADRPQIVTAIDRNTYELNELKRWAEALDDNINRVLIQNLSTLVPADVLPVRTANLAKKARYRLNLNILEFHVDPQGTAILNAHWYITEQGKKRSGQRKSYHAPASTTDIKLSVRALNDCLDRLSRDIALQLRQVVQADVLEKQHR